MIRILLEEGVEELEEYYFENELDDIPSEREREEKAEELNAKQALSISDRGYVLVTGENRYSGTGKELLEDPRVRSSFLGG